MDGNDRAPEFAALSRQAASAGPARVVADTGWGHPEAPALRVVVFATEGLIVVLEATTDAHGLHVDGFIRPAPSRPVVVHLRRTMHPEAALDRDARFSFTDLAPGPISLLFENPSGTEGTGIATEWVTL